MTTQITNQSLFDSKIKSLDVDVKNSGYGNILIITTNGEQIESDGQHGLYDFEEEYGFILIKD